MISPISYPMEYSAALIGLKVWITSVHFFWLIAFGGTGTYGNGVKIWFIKLNVQLFPLKMIWRCVICCLFVALLLRALLSHINTVHSSSLDFHVICGIDGCAQEYRVYNSFYYHVKRRHSSHFINHKSRSSGSQNAAQAKGNNCRACASADVGIQVEERLFENFGIPLQPEFLPNEHDVSSIPGNANDEDDFNLAVAKHQTSIPPALPMALRLHRWLNQNKRQCT